jgi:hypothetical protein
LIISELIIKSITGVRNSLATILGRGAGSAAEIPREFGRLLGNGQRELAATDSDIGRMSGIASFESTCGRVARSTVSADSEFDPRLPASVRNFPPFDQLEIDRLKKGNGGRNYLVSYRGERIGIYKPRADAHMIRSEITAWESSRILGVGDVPYTRQWIGPHGPGSLQEYVPNVGPAYGFKTAKGKGIAVFDYVMAKSDGHAQDVLERTSGEMVRVDNPDIVPERLADNDNYLVSSYVAENLGRRLPADVVKRISEVDPDRFSEFLHSRGYSRSAAEWAAARLAEVRSEQRITGDSWGCRIVDDTAQVVYPPGYESVLRYWEDHPWRRLEY